MKLSYKLIVFSCLLIIMLAGEDIISFLDWVKVLPTNGQLWRHSPKPSTSLWMNATVFERGGLSDVLQKRRTPQPVRGEKQCLIRVVKASGNPVDFKMVRNPQWPIKSLPSISGYDFAGTVEQCDPSSSKFKPGDRVFGMLATVSPKWGSFAEFVVADEDFIAGIPPSVSFTDAAATPLAALTAIQGLAKLGPVREGESILIHAGSGGVGVFAIQLASKVLKLNVFTTSTNVELCKSLGANTVIDYKKTQFEQYRYDYVFDAIGGDYLLRGMPVTNRHYMSILNDGWLDYFGTDKMIAIGELFSILYFNIKHYVSLGQYPKYTLNIVESNGSDLQVIANLLASGTIRVVVDSEFSGLEIGARQVHDRIRSGKSKGKVVLSIE